MDATSFVCNRAGMLVGAALACRSSSIAKGGINTITNVAGKEIAGAAIEKTEVALARAVTNGAKQGARTTVVSRISVAAIAAL